MAFQENNFDTTECETEDKAPYNYLSSTLNIYSICHLKSIYPIMYFMWLRPQGR